MTVIGQWRSCEVQRRVLTRGEDMKSATRIAARAFLLMPLLAGTIAFSQAPSSQEDFDAREMNFRAYALLLRQDVKAERKQIITDIMQLDEADAAKFWPIFDQYDAELTTIGDDRLQLIVDYARNYQHLTDEQANSLMNRGFDLEARRALLKKKYFDEMKTALSATQAARFFLIENQMQHIIDLQISAQLPVVPVSSN